MLKDLLTEMRRVEAERETINEPEQPPKEPESVKKDTVVYSRPTGLTDALGYVALTSVRKVSLDSDAHTDRRGIVRIHGNSVGSTDAQLRVLAEVAFKKALRR